MIDPIEPMGTGEEQISLGPVPAKKAESKLLAKSIGFMAIALLVTGVVGFLFAFLMAALFGQDGYINDTGYVVLMITLIVSLVLSLIVSFTFTKNAMTRTKAPWVSFLLYSALEGIFFGSFIIIPGVDFSMIGEAFGITALVFGACFLIGYFSKGEMKIALFVAMALFMGIGISSIIFLPLYFFGGYDAIYLYSYIVSVVIVVAVSLLVAFEARNIKKLAASSLLTSNNIALLCAMDLYCSFMTIFTRILYILLLSRSRN